MRDNRILTIAAIALMGGLLVAACGSDAEALSKPEFIEQANAICQASQDEADPLFEAAFAEFEDLDPNDPATQEFLYARFAEAMDEIKPILDQQLDDIRALEPPSEDKDLIETLIADQDAALTEFVGLLDAALAGDEEARAIIDSEEEDPFADIDRRAREYGLTVCGTQDG
ncbi:MAG: hypothetical protein OEU32_03375 [Acidimicrobiia bacterium]|nr:hypothetical protein [Acidimicrobiia bacterium]